MTTALSRALGLLPGLGLLGASGLAISVALKDAPAFDPAARETGIFADWRVPVAAGLYNRADYLFQVGFGYVQADLLASGVTEERDALAAFEVALARAETAERLLSDSVALAPAHAPSWTYLAWSRSLSGETDAAAAAMEASWALAPHSAQLAPTRLAFYALMQDLAEEGLATPPTPAAAAGAQRDVIVLARWNASYLAALAAGSPTLARFVESVSAGGAGGG